MAKTIYLLHTNCNYVERKTIKQYLEGGKGKDKGIVVPVFFLN
jgi:hypothetical protein